MQLVVLLMNVAGNILAAPALLRARGRLSVCIVCMQAALVALCCAQQPPATYAVDGVVENSVTHQPVARVLVEGRSDAIFTDSEGRFELHLPPGVTPITLRRPGYGNGQFSALEMQHAVVVGPNMPQLTFAITPSAGITGHVMLSAGDDADGIRFTLYQKRINEGHAQWTPSGNAAVGSEGVLRFPSLEANASYVLCSAPSPDRLVGPARRAPVSGYPGVCYPGGVDFVSAIAAPFTLAPGQQTQVEISLARQLFYPVSISVANAAQSAFIQVFDRSGRPVESPMRRNAPNGAFVYDLPNGSYYAESRQGAKPQRYGRLDFTVAGSPLEGLTLVLAPEQPIAIEIHRELTATSDAGGLINNRNGEVGPYINLNLISLDQASGGSVYGNLRPVEGSADGDAYEMDPVPPGTYRVQVGAAGFASYASAITSGGTDLLHGPLVITAGSSVPPIDITLRNDVGRLECRSRTSAALAPTGSPGEVEVAMIFVYVIPQSPGLQRIYESVGQSRGNASIPLMLPPGAYSVVAFTQPHDIDLANAEELSQLAKEGQTVTIEAGATAQVDLNPISTDAHEASQ